MSLNPLAPVTDYQSMLNRIFWFTTVSSIAAIWMLRLYIPALDAQLDRIDFSLKFDSERAFPIPASYLLPALAIGLVARVYRIHARVSDWLEIRECFDLDVIIAELAERTSIDLSILDEEQLRTRRHAIMRNAFYAFVSPSSPQIDSQLVYQALDAWSWFWVGVEAALLFVFTGFALVAASQYAVGLQTIGITIAAAGIGLPLMRSQCERYAVAQVRAILADPNRAAAVRAAFGESQPTAKGFRVAA